MLGIPIITQKNDIVICQAITSGPGEDIVGKTLQSGWIIAGWLGSEYFILGWYPTEERVNEVKMEIITHWTSRGSAWQEVEDCGIGCIEQHEYPRPFTMPPS